jgi:hypothetical protein
MNSNPVNLPQNGVLASLSTETLNTLADIIIAKLSEKNGGALLPKQDVVGSNPITRSIQFPFLLNTLLNFFHLFLLRFSFLFLI